MRLLFVRMCLLIVGACRLIWGTCPLIVGACRLFWGARLLIWGACRLIACKLSLFACKRPLFACKWLLFANTLQLFVYKWHMFWCKRRLIARILLIIGLLCPSGRYCRCLLPWLLVFFASHERSSQTMLGSAVVGVWGRCRFFHQQHSRLAAQFPMTVGLKTIAL